jgi:siderophore synthetase component
MANHERKDDSMPDISWMDDTRDVVLGEILGSIGDDDGLSEEELWKRRKQYLLAHPEEMTEEDWAKAIADNEM